MSICKIKKEPLMFFIYISVSIILTILLAKKGMQEIIIAIYLGIPLLIYLLKEPKRLIYAQIIYNLIIKWLITNLGIPNIANYFTDVLTVLIGIFLVKKYIKDKKDLNIKNCGIVVLILLLESILGLIINGQAIRLYIWGIRNIYRFFVFLFGCVVLLEKEDVDKIFKIFKVFFIINVILCTYQYFIMKLGQDYIGGTFGIQQGGNGYMNMFLIIVSAHTFINFQQKKCNIISFLLVIISSLYIATISELKMFYIELIAFILIGILLSKPNKRTIVTVVGVILMIYIAIQTLYVIYPGFEDFFNIEELLEYSGEGGYSNEDNLNRITAIETIEQLFLKNKNRTIIGIGTGNAEVSQFAMFNSEFAMEYSEILHYNWFSHAFMFLENGYAGLILYIGFFIMIFFDNIKMKRTNNEKGMGIFVQIISIMSIMIMWYNSTLRTETAYMWFFALSVGYIYNKKTEELKEKI